jgi:hypothetical protein
MEETNEFKFFEASVDTGPSLSEIMAPKVKRDKPDISHLEDAIKLDESGRPYLDLKMGDQIVIERYSGILNDKPWLDTKPYYINDADQVTGKLKLYFEELQQHATDNFLLGMKIGCLYKKMPANGRWDEPPKVKPVAKVVAPVQFTEHGEPIKKGRGRPKGVKNRPKDVIQAEKKEKAEMRLAKRAARVAKKKSSGK